MDWQVSIAKNGEKTLSLNGVQLYSRYRPREDAWKWIDSQFDDTQSSYLLIGLGLGYHAERLRKRANGKNFYVYYFDEYERLLSPIEEAVSTINHINFENCQILISNTWLKALQEHPLLPDLESIKINQQSYKKFSNLMNENFEANVQKWLYQPYPHYNKKVACLVASGPSLNETIHLLKAIQSKLDIFVVGSALKMLLKYGVKPNAVVFSDPQLHNKNQLEGTGWRGDLFFLSTSNKETVCNHLGEKYILFQEGYPLAENVAKMCNAPLIETGGSVSTTAISLIELLGYKQIVLFGQDMSFTSDKTHAEFSTSGKSVDKNFIMKKAISNAGEVVFTMPNLQIYARWIEKKVERSKLKVYTTSLMGLKIRNVPYINEEQLGEILKE